MITHQICKHTRLWQLLPVTQDKTQSLSLAGHQESFMCLSYFHLLIAPFTDPPRSPRSALSASLTSGFLLPIARYCQLIGVEMRNESSTIELPSLLTWQLVADAGNCYQKCNCSGLCPRFQQSSLGFLLLDTRYLPLPGLSASSLMVSPTSRKGN